VLVTAEDGLAALRVALALVESAQTDREVHLEDGLSSSVSVNNSGSIGTDAP
jgi:hypothetical protein